MKEVLRHSGGCSLCAPIRAIRAVTHRFCRESESWYIDWWWGREKSLSPEAFRKIFAYLALSAGAPPAAARCDAEGGGAFRKTFAAIHLSGRTLRSTCSRIFYSLHEAAFLCVPNLATVPPNLNRCGLFLEIFRFLRFCVSWLMDSRGLSVFQYFMRFCTGFLWCYVMMFEKLWFLRNFSKRIQKRPAKWV